MTIELALDALDFRPLLRPGDHVVRGQASAEPATLAARLNAQCADPPGLSAFIGMSSRPSLDATSAMRFQSCCGAGHDRAFKRRGALDILPCHYAELPGLLADRVDVLLLDLADDGTGRLSFGAALEYLAPLVDRARLVIAERRRRMLDIAAPEFRSALEAGEQMQAPPGARGTANDTARSIEA